jgi:hypothetical protein
MRFGSPAKPEYLIALPMSRGYYLGMANVGGYIDGGRELNEVELGNPILGRLVRRLMDGINMLATNTQSSATGETQAPKAPDAVSVKVSGEYMHIAIDHTGALNRNVQYFSEISPNDPAFSQPIVVDHGSSRTSHPFLLPTYLDGGSTKVSYYVRSYAQYFSSQPSAKTVSGGASAPVAYQMGGTTQMTLLPSRGSGTAANTGQQGGSGLGKVAQRRANLGL